MTDTCIIKKYANRRLYNTATSTYITYRDLAQLAREGEDFKIIDAKTEKDLTRQTLMQLLAEAEADGTSVVPIEMMKELVKFYGQSFEKLSNNQTFSKWGQLPHFLQQSMCTWEEMLGQQGQEMQQQAQASMDAAIRIQKQWLSFFQMPIDAAKKTKKG